MRLLILLIISCLTTSNTFSQTAKTIIQQVDDNMQGNSNKSLIKMSIVRPKYTRTITLKGWSLGKDYFMAYITAPAKEKGQVIMKIKEELWQYTPSINRMIKLPPSMMSQGFMGSDYSNDDMVKQSSIVNSYSHTLLKDTVLNNRSCYRIKMIPHEEANIVWGKVELWIDKDYLVILKANYYDEEDFLVRTLIGKKVKQFDGRYQTAIIELIPTDEPNNKTIIETISMEFNIPIKTRFFTQQNMKRIR